MIKRSEDELEEERCNRINESPYINSNLLINPDFSINQRGKVKYIGNIYGVDRWQGTQGSNITVVENGIKTECFDDTHNQGVKQYIECNMDLLVGKTFTLSLEVDTTGIPDEYINVSSKNHWFSINDVVTRISVKEKKSSEILTFSGVIQYNTGNYKPYLLVRLNTLTGTIIKWAKLELGSVATPFVPPDRATELLKCKRYYQKVHELRDKSAGTFSKISYIFTFKDYFIYGSGNVKNYIYCRESYYPQMRTIPTAKLVGTAQSDQGYYIGYIKGGSIDNSKEWIFTINADMQHISIGINEKNGNITDEDFNKKCLYFAKNCYVELDAEIQ